MWSTAGDGWPDGAISSERIDKFQAAYLSYKNHFGANCEAFVYESLAVLFFSLSLQFDLNLYCFR